MLFQIKGMSTAYVFIQTYYLYVNNKHDEMK